MEFKDDLIIRFCKGSGDSRIEFYDLKNGNE